MTTKRQEFVTFRSPGSFVAESTTKAIASRDTRLATEMAKTIVERYDAKPYGFYFTTRITSEPIPDGEGGTLEVESKVVEESGMYFLGGVLETYDVVMARDDPKEDILRSNMRSNAWWIISVTTNSFRSCQTFTEKDFVVDADGVIVERGDDPKHVAYRKARDEEQK